MTEYVMVPVDGWEIQEIDHPIYEGISIRSKGISYCVWKLEEPAVYLLLKAMIEASPEPESAEPVCFAHPEGLQNLKEKSEALIAYKHPANGCTEPLFRSPQPATSQWQPMGTCPNDEDILIYRDDGSLELIEAEENDFTWVAYTGKEYGVNKPKLWMPQPKPQEEES